MYFSVSKTKQGKNAKIMAITYAYSIPVIIYLKSGQLREVMLFEAMITGIFIRLARLLEIRLTTTLLTLILLKGQGFRR
jgi:hypothetical protein